MRGAHEDPAQAAPGGAWGDDLSWVQGVAVHVEIEGGFWIVRFGGATAPFGGELILGNPPQLNNAQPGCHVRVTGEARPDDVGFFMSGTRFEVDQLEILP